MNLYLPIDFLLIKLAIIFGNKHQVQAYHLFKYEFSSKDIIIESRLRVFQKLFRDKLI